MGQNMIEILQTEILKKLEILKLRRTHDSYKRFVYAHYVRISTLLNNICMLYVLYSKLVRNFLP